MGADSGTCTSNLTGIVDVPDVDIPETEGFDVITDGAAPQDNFVQDTAPPPNDTGTPDVSTTDSSGD
jgi:hypothetical protein